LINRADTVYLVSKKTNYKKFLMGCDELTNLDNRSSFLRTLNEQVNYASKHKIKAGLLLIDIDRFQRVNAQHGYDVGDKILIKFSELIGSVKRKQDYIARVGDNTFALLLMGIMNTGHAELAARKVLRLLEVPFSYLDHQIRIECSISICIFPLHALDAKHLMIEAESVLHETKKHSSSIGIAKDQGDEDISEYWDIEMAISQALKFNEFSVYYQPKIDIKNNRVSGAEALLRWKHQTRGFVSPDIFIPIAEQSGMIKPITAWVINTSLRHAAKWSDKWGRQTVSVNIPPEFLLMPDFFDMVSNSLNLWESENVSLTLEIIERSFISQVDRTIEALEKLRAIGVKISIDDFGTGYSSLSYFEKMPVDEIKIDQAFIFNLLQSKPSRDIVRLIRDLGHAFNLQVVAEGVEEALILKYLQKIECDLVQGYFYSKPLPNEKYLEWLSKVKLPEI
jgi:diguanylate cyclase (GGDEF)-like protein